MTNKKSIEREYEKEINEIKEKRSFIHGFLTEDYLVKRIVGNNGDVFNISIFENLIIHSTDRKEFWEIEGFKVSIAVDRIKFGFKEVTKPGDFDIMILPFNKDGDMIEKLVAIEVKIARPLRKKPTKSSKSMGSTQIKGLINDGFPYIGLLHVVMAEPLKENEKRYITHVLGGIGEHSLDVPWSERRKINILVDDFSFEASSNQFNRLQSLNLPNYIGLKTIGINLLNNTDLALSIPLERGTEIEQSSKNPFVKNETLFLAKNYFSNEKNYIIQTRK